MLDAFRIDVIDLGRTFNTLDSNWSGYILPSGRPAQYPVWFRPQNSRMVPIWHIEAIDEYH